MRDRFNQRLLFADPTPTPILTNRDGFAKLGAEICSEIASPSGTSARSAVGHQSAHNSANAAFYEADGSSDIVVSDSVDCLLRKDSGTNCPLVIGLPCSFVERRNYFPDGSADNSLFGSVGNLACKPRVSGRFQIDRCRGTARFPVDFPVSRDRTGPDRTFQCDPEDVLKSVRAHATGGVLSPDSAFAASNDIAPHADAGHDRALPSRGCTPRAPGVVFTD